MKMTKRLITAILFVGVLLTGLIAYQIVGPDDEECKAAIGQVIDDSIVRSMDDKPQVSDEEAARVIRWKPFSSRTGRDAVPWRWCR